MSQQPDFPEFDEPQFVETVQPPSAGQQVPAKQYRKMGFSIYTVMLILSFACLLTSLILFLIEARRY
jgi:hypothetical protein